MQAEWVSHMWCVFDHLISRSLWEPNGFKKSPTGRAKETGWIDVSATPTSQTHFPSAWVRGSAESWQLWLSSLVHLHLLLPQATTIPRPTVSPRALCSDRGRPWTLAARLRAWAVTLCAALGGSWWTQFIKNELWSSGWKRRSVNMWMFFCEPKCASVVFCVSGKSLYGLQLLWQRLIYEHLLSSSSWLTTRSFERSQGGNE